MARTRARAWAPTTRTEPTAYLDYVAHLRECPSCSAPAPKMGIRGPVECTVGLTLFNHWHRLQVQQSAGTQPIRRGRITA